MAETNARIMDMVRREIDKNPSVSSEQLYEMAKKSDSGIGSLSVRQFHARYPLQVKRARANARKGRGSAAKKTGARRGRPPGKTGARRGRPPGKTAKRGAAKSAAGGTAKKARRGRPPGSGRKAAAKRATGPRSAGRGGRRPGRPRRTAASPAPASPGRDEVRSLLLQFARDIAAAEGKADVVEVIGEVDGWVDRLMAAAS